MAKFRITGPDGTAYEVTAPDGTPPEDVMRVVEAQKQSGGNWLQRFGSSIASAYRGQQDPRFADLPTYQPTNVDLMAGQNRAKTVTFDDAAYGDILRTQLGDRFVKMEKDANGYDILHYRDDDGSIKQGYVNKPGLDSDDIDRAIAGTIPFLIGGGAVGSLTKGAGLLPRMVTQAATGAGISMASDAAASRMGSEQGISPGRAALAAGGGAVAEAIAPVASSLWRAVRGGKPYLDDAGRLTAEAAAKARAHGLDPDAMDPDMIEDFARALNTARDPKEVASAIQTNRFGIPTTKATRTKDPELSMIEKDIRAGNAGPDAKGVLEAFDDKQRRAIQTSALGRVGRDPNAPVDPYRDGIGAMVAPTRSVVTPAGAAPSMLGSSIQQGLKGAKDKGDALISGAYAKVGPMEAAEGGFQRLPEIIRGRLGPMRLNATTPTANAMIEDIMAFTKGKAVQSEVAGFIGQAPAANILDQQKGLLAIYKGAANPSDRAAAKAVYDGFNDWIDDIADKGLIKGDPASAAHLRTARQVTREIKSLFDPRGKGIDPAASKILSEIVDGDNNADNIITALFGGAGSQVPPKKGAVDAIRHIKAILDPAKGLVDADDGMRVMNDIRMAYWSRLVIDKKGKMASPLVAANNIDQALRNQSGLMLTLFKPEEVRKMKQYAQALGEAAFKDPNPSGTATTLRALMRGDGGWLKTILTTQSQRELFSKHNVFMSRIYRLLARAAPVDLFGAKGAAAMAAARGATSQALTKRPPAVLGHYGAAVGAASDDEGGP